ncbi:MAG: hypothetical protein ACRC8S_16870 [Fimbriiglobus sp.]
MRAKHLLLSASVAFTPFLSGCLSNNYKGYHQALHCQTPNPFPNKQRSQVYLFMMNGTDVLELSGMLTLRDELARNGFSKVYYAQMEDKDWFVREMARLHRDEPQARILLLGYGTAATRTTEVACETQRLGVPLDALVLLDPMSYSGNLTEQTTAPSVIISSHNWSGAKEVFSTERIELQGTGHLNTPTHPQTLDTLVSLMTTAASRVPVQDIRLLLPHLPLRDKPEPTPRPVTK